MKVPFDIKFRPQIESGEYKVIDQFGYVLTLRDVINDVWYFSLRYPNTDYETERIYDHPENHLFIVTPEPELSEFEKGCIRLYQDGRDDGFAGNNLSEENLKECSAELLELAKGELTKQGNLILPIEAFEKRYVEAQEKGRKEALKDLPRWKKYSKGTEIDPFAVVRFPDGTIGRSRIANDGYYVLEVSEMLKLPGFND